jgi:hypothetical protein
VILIFGIATFQKVLGLSQPPITDGPYQTAQQKD